MTEAEVRQRKKFLMARGPENQRTRKCVTAKPRSKLPLGNTHREAAANFQRSYSFLFRKGISVPPETQAATPLENHTTCASHRAAFSQTRGVPLSLNKPLTSGFHFPNPSLAFHGHHGS